MYISHLTLSEYFLFGAGFLYVFWPPQSLSGDFPDFFPLFLLRGPLPLLLVRRHLRASSRHVGLPAALGTIRSKLNCEIQSYKLNIIYI